MSGDKLTRIDRDVLAYIAELDDGYSDPDESQPLEKWWWHLAKIKAGTYPLETLPLELRESYRHRPPTGRPPETAHKAREILYPGYPL